MLVGLLVAAVSLALAGCGSAAGTNKGGASSSSGKLNIAFANINNSSTFFNEMTLSMKAAQKVTGDNVSYYDNKSNAQTTVENAQLMVQSKPDLIVEYYGDESAATAADTIFKRAGIPCITINVRGTGYCKWFNVSNPDMCGQTGRALGTIANARGWTGRNTTVVLIAANSFGQAVNTCQGFAYAEMEKVMSGLAHINSFKDIRMTTTKIGNTTIQIDGGGLLDKAFTNMSSALSSIPKSQNVVVYAIGDDMAVGAMRAIQQANRTKNTILGGWGNSPQALQELRSNNAWVAEGDPFYGSWGEYMLAMAPQILKNATIPTLTTSPMAVLTKDTTVPGTAIVPVGKLYKNGDQNASLLPPLVPVESREIADAGIRGTVGNDYLAGSGVLQKFANVQGVAK